ncbi:MAG: c-type cytochrome domain-containing protein [Deferrisomatales bacterium]|nr:c-type cytochrome domain-containing protein [Deferrisomatales bacterium]
MPAVSAADPSYADVAPVLNQRCVICHSGEAAPLGLRLDGYEALREGSVNGAVVEPGDPAASELIRRVKGTARPRMPMTGPPFLSEDEIALLERWVEKGAEGPAAAAPSVPVVPQPVGPGGLVTYREVEPILLAQCARCHAADGIMGPAPEGYRLTSYEETLATRDRARVVPGHPEASEFLRRIRGQARPRMPLDGPPYLDEAETRLVEEWIAQGAPDEHGTPARVPAGASVRLHGTLDPGRQLDGLPLVIGPRTRFDDSPGPGDYVQVRGTLDEAGNVHVERVRRR